MKKLLVILALLATSAHAQFGGIYAGRGTSALVTGGSCTNQLVRSLDTSAVPTCASVASADIAAMTSAALRGILSDESGTGIAYFQGGDIGTPSAGVLTNATGLPQAGTVGLTTADSPQFTGINLGHATDTTITRTGAGAIAVEGVSVLLSGGALGTPSSGVATNLTGTAAGLTAGTVTTNANLTGPITSTGNATAVAAQTGTGSTFVMQATPTLTTPVIGAATGTSVVLTGAAPQVTLGANTTTLGSIKMFGSTSGDATLQPSAVAGTSTVVTIPAASTTIPVASQVITFAGPTAARTYTFPDAAATIARTDAANTFTGVQTMTSPALTTPAITGAATWQDGVKQTFNPDGTTPGLNVGSNAGDPSTPANGDILYNSTTNKFRCYENGAWANCIGAAGGTALSGITAATGANTIASGTNSGQVWNWALTADSVTAMTFGETTAATGGTSTSGVPNQVIGKFTTLAASTASSFSAYSRGTHVASVSPSTAQMLFNNGSASAPGIAAAGVTTSGLFWDVTPTFNIAISGATHTRFFSDRITTTAHLVAAGTTPTIGTCGTTPSVVGKDDAMLVTVGTGGSATSCGVTFATAHTGNAPICVVQSDTDIVAFKMTTTTTALTVTAAAAFTASSKLHILCKGCVN